MKNKTTNVFRFKTKKARQPRVHMFSQNQMSKEEGSGEKSVNQRFSSEYISLAKKFNLKILNQQQHTRGLSSCTIYRGDRLRIKTDFARSKQRYNNQPYHILDSKHHSYAANDDATSRSNRSNKLAQFNLNKNTVYNDTFLKLKTQADNSLFIQQESIKLSLLSGDSMLISLANHCRKLLNIKESLEKKTMLQLEIIKEIKLYVLREEGYSICKIDRCFNGQPLKKQIKELIIIQRMVLLSIVSNVASRHLFEMLDESNRAVEIILGFWYQIINNTYSDNIYKLEIQQQSEIKNIIELLSEAKLLTKSNIRLLIDTLVQKLPVLYKHCRPLYTKISFLLTFSQDITINRAFYELLTAFATYLTQFESNHQINLDNLAFFATCPSPYLVKSCKKGFTLVVDLDETLVYSKAKGNSKDKKNKAQTIFRPGSFEFIEQLSQFYEIIVFTTSIEAYAREVTRSFKGIDHYLFRQHAVRVKSGLVKDLGRIGRDLKKTVILDDLVSSFKFHKENGIRIKAWRGEAEDKQLESIKQLLIKIAKSKTNDITKDLTQYRDEISKRTTIALQTPSKPKPYNH